MSSYNGWSNYETWLVSLWFGDVFADLANEDSAGGEVFEEFVLDMLESEGHLPETGFAADIMNAALRKVDWRELAEHFAPESEDDEESDA